jgi:hypothetical protein
MPDAPTRLLRTLDSDWDALRASFDGLPPEELVRPRTLGEWSLKDILAHVSTWEEEALHHLPVILAGSRPPRYASVGGIDAFNARAAERDAALSLDAVLSRFNETHEHLMAFVATIPPEQLASGTRARRRLQLDAYSHYRLHAGAIREWRETTRL